MRRLFIFGGGKWKERKREYGQEISRETPLMFMWWQEPKLKLKPKPLLSKRFYRPPKQLH